MPKKDYLNDPQAPEPNALVVAVAVVVRNTEEDVLLIKRGDNGLWALPGGAQELGESSTEAAVREVEEETGITVKITGLVGIYSDPRHVIAYDDGEVRQEFSICYRAEPVAGELQPSTESIQVAWIRPNQVPNLDLHPSMRLRIEHGMADSPTPHLG